MSTASFAVIQVRQAQHSATVIRLDSVFAHSDGLYMQKKTITLWRRQSWLEKDKGQEMQISFDTLPTDVIALDGNVDVRQVHAKLHHIPEPRFLLNTRGFHWINEYPFNGYDD